MQQLTKLMREFVSPPGMRLVKDQYGLSQMPVVVRVALPVRDMNVPRSYDWEELDSPMRIRKTFAFNDADVMKVFIGDAIDVAAAGHVRITVECMDVVVEVMSDLDVAVTARAQELAASIDAMAL